MLRVERWDGEWKAATKGTAAGGDRGEWRTT